MFGRSSGHVAAFRDERTARLTLDGVAMTDIDLLSLRFGRDLGKTPPLGLLYLAASVERAGWLWQMHDCQFDPAINAFDIDALADRIRRLHAPALGLSVFNDAIPLVIGTLDAMRDELCGRRIFLGGPGVVGIADRLLDRLPQVEAVVVGEGETALPLLLAHHPSVRNMPGVFLRDQAHMVRGKGRTTREDLNLITDLPWDWCRGRGYSRVPLSTMRGCPFDCQFCEIIAFMGRRVTQRDLSLALRDLDQATAAIGSLQVDVLDDTFTLNKNRVLAFCKLLAERSPRVEFSVYSRVDTIDREMMQSLADAGCRRVFFGLDGGDPGVLSRISKRIQIDDAERVIHEAAEYFDVTASLIWGYPFESWPAFVRAMNLAERLHDWQGAHRIQPQLHLLSPSAGTPLFDEFGARLVLDESVEGLVCGTLGVNSFRTRYADILAIMRRNPVLAAPFHRYETPDFERKADYVEQLCRQLDAAAGAAVADLLVEV
jgi:anaerobic magnesium-protoporphyrin IX monomethyl ester cyclase